ncbi:MAG: response regulator transcription factor [Armatimonadota bacterium]
MISQSNKLIAVIDDEPDIVELINIHLQKSGFKVKTFQEAESFLEFIKNTQPSIIILDLMLPGADGLEICRYLKSEKKYSFIPIIMLTARAEETDKIIGLELGADDYITKPFSVKELTARVKTVLRRASSSAKSDSADIIEIGGALKIDVQKYEVRIYDKKVDLTTTEFKMLELLAEKRGRVLKRDDILDCIWGDDKDVLDRTIDTHMKNLRKKLGDASDLIKNIRGIGYKIEI